MSVLIGRLKEHAIQRATELGVALVTSGAPTLELSWSDLFGAVNRRATGLNRAGVSPGDIVFVISPSIQEQIVSFLSSIAIGAVPTILSFPSTKQSRATFLATLRPIVEHVGPRWAVCSSELMKIVEETGVRPLSSTPNAQESLQAELATLPEPTTGTGAFMQFSSGTTGLRKCVTISERMFVAQAQSYAEAVSIQAADRVVSWLPLYHDMGLVAAFLMPLFHGVASIQMSPFDWLRDPAMFLRAISRFRGTITYLPNFAFEFLAKSVDVPGLEAERVSLDSLRGVVNCSEPVKASSHTAFMSAFRALGLVPKALQASYALAENTFAVTHTSLDEILNVDVVRRDSFTTEHRAIPIDSTARPDARLAFVSCGRPIPGTSVRIADGVPERSVGQIELSGPCVISGYFGESQERIFSADGWFKTGDLGYFANGELYVTGRAKDLIIHRGSNIYPQDVEEVIGTIEGCKPGRVVVFGVENVATGTEDVIAMLEPADDGPQATALLDAARRVVVERFGFALRDAIVTAPGTLKKSTSGKLSRSGNRASYLTMPSTAPQATPVDTTSEHRVASTPASTSLGDEDYVVLSDNVIFDEKGELTEVRLPNGGTFSMTTFGVQGLKAYAGTTPRHYRTWLKNATKVGKHAVAILERLRAGGALVHVQDVRDDFRDDNFYGAVLRSTSKDLVFQFRGAWYDVVDGVPPREFASRTGLAHHNLVALRDEQDSFYQRGVSNAVPSMDALVVWMRGFHAALPAVERVHCMGTSAGASAAMIAGHRLRVATVWAFSPVAARDTNLVELLAKDNGVTKFDIWYGSQNSSDRQVAESLRDLPRVRLYPLDTDSHLTARVLWERNALPELLRAQPTEERRRSAGTISADDVLGVLREIVPSAAATLTPTTSLMGLLDSFATVQLLARIEQKFGVVISQRQVLDADLVNVSAIAEALARA